MPSMRLTTSPVMPCSGESNGSAACYNTSVPSDPQISICLAQLPAGQTDPLSARSRSSQTKRTVRIGVGLLPYISIASVWQQRRPVITDLAAGLVGWLFSSTALEPVWKVHVLAASRLVINWIMAIRIHVSVVSGKASKSLLNRRERLSQPKVRSTIQRHCSTRNP